MPVDVTQNFIMIRVRAPQAFDKDSQIRTITLDKKRGIRARIQRLKGKKSTAIRTLLFPKKNFTRSQAIKWAKDHNFSVEEVNMTVLEAKWTRKYINDLPDSAFLYIAPGGEKDSEGKTKPRSLRYFPYKDKNGNVDLPHLRNALARIPQSKLPDDVKRRVMMKARRIAKQYGINVSEEFLDPEALRFPIFEPFLEQTIYDFNTMDLNEDYSEEQINEMEAKLVKVIRKFAYDGVETTEYDDNGSVTTTDVAEKTETEWHYDDGSVSVDKSEHKKTMKNSYSTNLPNEVFAEISDDEIDILMAEDEDIRRGHLIERIREARGFTIIEASLKSGIPVNELRAIESGKEPEEWQLNAVAKAFGMKLEEIESLFEAFGIQYGEQEIQIIDDVIEVVEEEHKKPFTQEIFEEFDFGTSKKQVVRFPGKLTFEEKENNMVRFRVALFKLDEVTANGNRYTTECAKNLVEDISKLRRSKGNALQEGKSVLDITSNLPDMMPTHDPRKGQGNPLLSKAGVVVAAEIGKVEGDDTLFIIGETIETQAGKDMAVLIKRGMVRGVSLAGYPVEYEENDYGGKDVFRLHLVGADFTDEGANLIQFKNPENASFNIMEA